MKTAILSIQEVVPALQRLAIFFLPILQRLNGDQKSCENGSKLQSVSPLPFSKDEGSIC